MSSQGRPEMATVTRPAPSRSALPRIALLALIWGSAFLWIKLADRGFSAVEVTLARLALGAAVLFVVVLARREKIPRSARLWRHVAVAALFANAVPYLLFAVAEQRVNSATAGIINATTPLWTVVLALAVRHLRSVTGWQAAGLAAGFAGAVLVFTPWRTASGLVSAGGLECLAASASYAISYIYMDRFLARRGISPVVLSACQLLVASVMLAVALAVSGAPAPHVTAASAAAVTVLGIVGTGFAYVLNYQIITSEGAAVAATVTYLLPVVAIALGVLVLAESVTVTTIAGIALILAGVALTRRRQKQADARRGLPRGRVMLVHKARTALPQNGHMTGNHEERNRYLGFPVGSAPHRPRGREPQRVMGFPVDWFDDADLGVLRFLAHPVQEYRRWRRRRRLGPYAAEETARRRPAE